MKGNVLVILSLLFSANLFADDSSSVAESVKTGELKCKVLAGTGKADCTNFDMEDGICASNMTEVANFSADITAPQACIDDPMNCEGGPINQTSAVKAEASGLTFKAKYDDDKGISIAIQTGPVEIYSNNSKKLGHVNGAYEANSVHLKAGEKFFWLTCNNAK